MFDNIGGKLKGLAITVCVIGIIVSVIAGISLYSVGFEGGIAIAIFGSLIAWVSSFVTYGFGELISVTTDIRERLYYMERTLARIETSINKND